MDLSPKKHENYIEKLLIVQTTFAILHFVGDVVIETLSLVGVIEEFPIRIGYIFLSLVAAYAAYKTLDSIKVDKYAVAHEDVQLGLVQEVGLLFSDLWFLFYDGYYDVVLWYRLFFMVVNLINLAIMCHVACKYNLWAIRYKGSI